MRFYTLVSEKLNTTRGLERPLHREGKQRFLNAFKSQAAGLGQKASAEIFLIEGISIRIPMCHVMRPVVL